MLSTNAMSDSDLVWALIVAFSGGDLDKAEAIRSVKVHELPVAKVSKLSNVHRATLHRWVREFDHMIDQLGRSRRCQPAASSRQPFAAHERLAARPRFAAF